MLEVNSISNIEKKSLSNSEASKNKSKTNFSSYLGESKTIDDIFNRASKKYNVSVDLLKAVGKAESNFDEKAVSRCGAQGIMQLMPATAASLGVTNSFDAEQNIMGGSKYISDLLKKYDGDESLALAAYNAGSGNVAKYGGIPPFKETQNYVVKVMKYMNQGVDIPPSSNTVTTNTASTKAPSTTVITPPNASLYNEIVKQDLETTDDLIQKLEDVFSYNDYLSFLGKFLEEEQETEKDKSLYPSNQIKYNVPVMTLLNSIK